MITRIHIAVIVLLALFCLVGSMDYDDAVREQRIYCQNVHTGVHSDYRGTFKEECPQFQSSIIEK